MENIKINLTKFVTRKLNREELQTVLNNFMATSIKLKLFGPNFNLHLGDNRMHYSVNEQAVALDGKYLPPLLTKEHQQLFAFFFEKTLLYFGLGSLNDKELLKPEFQNVLIQETDNSLQNIAIQQNEKIDEVYNFIYKRMIEKKKFKYSRWFFFCESVIEKIIKDGVCNCNTESIIQLLTFHEIVDSKTENQKLRNYAYKILQKITKIKLFNFSKTKIFYRDPNQNYLHIPTHLKVSYHPVTAQKDFVLQFSNDRTLFTINKKITILMFAEQFLEMALNNIVFETRSDGKKINCLTIIKNFFLEEELATVIHNKIRAAENPTTGDANFLAKCKKAYQLINENRIPYQKFYELQTKN